MSSFAEMIANITPEIYQNLKQAVEIGKWPDGRLLTREQKELTLQAMIAWEQHNLPEEERTGSWVARNVDPRPSRRQPATPCRRPPF